MPTAHALLKNLRMSPQKVRLVVDLIRGKKVDEALVELQYLKKHAARPVLKLLQSAIANAKENHGLLVESLRIKTATVDGGPIIHRSTHRAFGRATPIRKRTSHVKIILEGKEQTSKETALKTET